MYKYVTFLNIHIVYNLLKITFLYLRFVGILIRFMYIFTYLGLHSSHCIMKIYFVLQLIINLLHFDFVLLDFLIKVRQTDTNQIFLYM